MTDRFSRNIAVSLGTNSPYVSYAPRFMQQQFVGEQELYGASDNVVLNAATKSPTYILQMPIGQQLSGCNPLFKSGGRWIHYSDQFTSQKPKPDAAKPDAAKPDAAKPDAAKPDAAKPDAAKPDAAKPDAAKPATTDGNASVSYHKLGPPPNRYPTVTFPWLGRTRHVQPAQPDRYMPADFMTRYNATERISRILH